jgi:hypothetical protein
MKELIIDLNAYLNTCNVSRIHLSDLHAIVKKIEKAPTAFFSQIVCKELVLWAEKLGTENIAKSDLHEILHKNLPETYFAVIEFFQARDEFFTVLEDFLRENKPDFIARNLFSNFIHILKKSQSSTVLICRDIILWVEAFKNPHGFDFDEDIRWKDEVLSAVQKNATSTYTKARVWMLMSGDFAASINELKESVDALSVSEFCSALYKILQDNKSVEAAELTLAVSAIDKNYWETMISQTAENKHPLRDIYDVGCALNHVLYTVPAFNLYYEEFTQLLTYIASQENLQSKTVFDELERWAEGAAKKSMPVGLKETLQDFAFKISISRILENYSSYVADKIRENLLREKSVKEGSAFLSGLRSTNSADIILLSAVKTAFIVWRRGKDKRAVMIFPSIWTPEKMKADVKHVLAPRDNGVKNFL